MENTLKVGLLGAGYISSWHAEALKRLPGVKVSAVCDLSKSAAQGLADAFGVELIFSSLETMLDAQACDVVHVLTPPHLHASVTRQILESDHHALVEKPLALTARECRELQTLATERGLKLGVNHNFLSLPSYERLRSDVKNGVLGPLDTLTVNWQFPLPPLRSGPYSLWMLRSPENLLFELGPHLFSCVQDLVGPIENISVRLRNPIEIPGDITHFQSWQILADAESTSVTLNLSLVEGQDNRSVEARGVCGMAKVSLAEDTYQIETSNTQEIIVGPLLNQIGQAGQHLRNGFSNALRQGKSFNRLSPYGLSIARSLELYYNSFEGEQDPRVSAETAAEVIDMVEQAVEVARPDFVLPEVPQMPENPPQPTVLVIGGTGFIGRSLTHALADKGYAVRVLSRGRAGGFERADGRISVFTGQLHDFDNVMDAMKGIDTVFHLAKAIEKDWDSYVKNDVEVTRMIGKCCLKSGVKRLIYTGTIDSYDASEPNRTITEETGFDPDLTRRNLYARSKAACEGELLKLWKEQNLPLVIARPGIVIGKGGPLQHWGIGMWHGAGAVKLWGDGKTIMPFVLVEDVADGLIAAMEKPGVEGQSFNLIGDPMLSARDYFAVIHEYLGAKIHVKPMPISRYYLTDMVKYYAKVYLAKKHGITKPSYRDWKSRTQASPFSNVRAKEVLGWKPEADRARFIHRGVVEANLFGYR